MIKSRMKLCSCQSWDPRRPDRSVLQPMLGSLGWWGYVLTWAWVFACLLVPIALMDWAVSHPSKDVALTIPLGLAINCLVLRPIQLWPNMQGRHQKCKLQQKFQNCHLLFVHLPLEPLRLPRYHCCMIDMYTCIQESIRAPTGQIPQSRDTLWVPSYFTLATAFPENLQRWSSFLHLTNSLLFQFCKMSLQ